MNPFLFNNVCFYLFLMYPVYTECGQLDVFDRMHPPLFNTEVPKLVHLWWSSTWPDLTLGFCRNTEQTDDQQSQSQPPAAEKKSERTINKRLQRTQAQVNEVVDIMRVNIEKVLERDKNLSQLDDRAGELLSLSSITLEPMWQWIKM